MKQQLGMHKAILILILSATSISTSVAFAAEQSRANYNLSLRVIEQINTLAWEKAFRTRAQRKVNSQLIYAMKIKRGDMLKKSMPILKAAVEIASDGTTLVDIKARVTPSLLAEIERIGGTVINSFEQYNAIRATLPLEEIEFLAEYPDIRNIRPAQRAFLNKVNTSEGDVAHSAVTARDMFGVDGTGVKIGVLSDSVDYLSQVQATGNLPSATVLEDDPGNSGEGTAMLEIVHDLAPGAQLFFATAWKGPASFAANIQALAAAGCQVIVDDISYFNESPFQDDIISQAVNTVTANGVLYFSSAGNSGNLNDGESGVWEGDYNGVANPYSSLLFHSSVHNFGGGDTTNQITEASSVYNLFWADPLGGAANDYDLYILNQAADAIEWFSQDVQDGDDDPYEEIQPRIGNIFYDTTNRQVVIAKWSGQDRFIYFSSNRGRLEHGTDGQIRGHSAAENGFGVAAVGAEDRATPFDGTESVETFSTDGPRRVFFQPDGTPITPGNFSSTGGMVRQKPDIAAADGVQTATPGFDPFYGTSAAAPHAAAIAGLMLSANPNLTIDQVRNIFRATALDIEAPGWDRDSGYGIIMAGAVLGYSPFSPAITTLLLLD